MAGASCERVELPAAAMSTSTTASPRVSIDATSALPLSTPITACAPAQGTP